MLDGWRPVFMFVGNADAGTLLRVYWLLEQVLRGGSGVEMLGGCFFGHLFD
jgi:hypothetical protein